MKFKTDEINKIKDYFTTEIREEETTSKTYSIYIAALNYLVFSIINGIVKRF